MSTNPKARKAGFKWRTHVRPEENRPELTNHLRNILKGHVELGPACHFRSKRVLDKLIEHVTHNRAIVKFCRAGQMLHWMSDRVQSREIVLIMRHPCAVIASMLNMGDNWQPQDMEDRSLKERFNEEIPEPIARELRTIPGAVNSWVGHLATQWSLDHYFALHEHPEGPDDYPWVLTSYERLFIDGGGGGLERIVHALRATVNKSMQERLGVASSFASDDFQQNKEHQLTKWRKEFTTEQIDIILSVVSAFNLGFYTADPTPDSDRLFRFQRPSARPASG